MLNTIRDPDYFSQYYKSGITNRFNILKNLTRKCKTWLKRYQLSLTSFPPPISRCYHKFSSQTTYKYAKPPRKVSCSTRFKFCRYRLFDICRGDRNKRFIFIFFIFTSQPLRAQPKTVIKIERTLLSILCRLSCFLYVSKALMSTIWWNMKNNE